MCGEQNMHSKGIFQCLRSGYTLYQDNGKWLSWSMMQKHWVCGKYLGSVFSLPICENANKKGVSVNYVGIFHI